MSEKKQLHPIAAARVARGISQVQLAALCDMQYASISEIERGRQPRVYVHDLYRIGQALGIDEWWTLASETNLAATSRRQYKLSPERAAYLREARMRHAAGLPPLPKMDEDEEE